MKIRLFALVSLGIVVSMGCHRVSQAPKSAEVDNGNFALVLERSSSGWAARCEFGCRWKEVKMTCENCSVRLDVAGISAPDIVHEVVTGFAFVVSNTDSGWQARGLSGVTWKELAWGCEGGSCRARIDQAGVGGV